MAIPVSLLCTHAREAQCPHSMSAFVILLRYVVLYVLLTRKLMIQSGGRDHVVFYGINSSGTEAMAI